MNSLMIFALNMTVVCYQIGAFHDVSKKSPNFPEFLRSARIADEYSDFALFAFPDV